MTACGRAWFEVPGPVVENRVMPAMGAAFVGRPRRAVEVIAAGAVRRTARAGAFYSHFVAFMKLFLPMIATALMLIVAIWPQLTLKDEGFRIGVANLSVEDAKNLTMIRPRYTGVDKENRPFTLTADRARQASGDDQMIQLTEPKADVTLEDGTWIALTARSGNFFRDLKLLDLFGSVNLFHDQGYEFHTSSAQFDLAEGNASGNERVQGQGSFGTIGAQGFRILNKGEAIIFTGKAHMVLYRDTRKPGR
jgi:lipopolysaccharide export system protein LptC